MASGLRCCRGRAFSIFIFLSFTYNRSVHVLTQNSHLNGIVLQKDFQKVFLGYESEANLIITLMIDEQGRVLPLCLMNDKGTGLLSPSKNFRLSYTY